MTCWSWSSPATVKGDGYERMDEGNGIVIESSSRQRVFSTIRLWILEPEVFIKFQSLFIIGPLHKSSEALHRLPITSVYVHSYTFESTFVVWGRPHLSERRVVRKKMGVEQTKRERNRQFFSMYTNLIQHGKRIRWSWDAFRFISLLLLHH